MSFSIGQRWLSDTESELGLGIIIGVDTRTVSVLFPQSDATRVYSQSQAPLSRVIFNTGDFITDIEGKQWLVGDVNEQSGVVKYFVQCPDNDEAGKWISESRLAAHLQLAKPLERLLAGQVEPKEWFELRFETHQRQNHYLKNPLRGLLGARIGLVPHQLYIAHEVGHRLAPRVLLADEVGLGKTIEAALIVHLQLKTHASQRVLILVPDSLQYQWMIEMRRRFNLAFSIFDLVRTAAIREHDEEANPFLTEQRIIASIDLLLDHPDLQAMALEAGFDLLVVDEAHHLVWDEEQGGNDKYDLVALFAKETKGLLLLTATPEQLGVTSHFARLRLLDPDRYFSLDHFLEEETQFSEIAALAEPLIEKTPLNQAQKKQLNALIEKDVDEHPEQALDELLDRHGVGRNLFRNTREAIQGFPKRVCYPVPLKAPQGWPKEGKLGEQMWPEEKDISGAWLETDVRIPWLINLLKTTLKNQKVLLIARSGPVVEAIEAVLRLHAGIRSSIFHEGMTLLERDQAAAYFADEEVGAQILLCSEIGSEGRNFQFAHHLVLFDLPSNPDTLEQRIGRLDRIGQTEQISLHVPFYLGTAQERMFHWYHQALNIFNSISPAAQPLHEAYIRPLKDFLLDGNLEGYDAFLQQVHDERLNYEVQLQAGRDRLLEYNSCRPNVAGLLVNQMCQYDAKQSLDDYLTRLMSATNIDYEEQSDGTLVIHPSDQMMLEGLEIPEEGLTATFDREFALKRDDVSFMSLEHPFIESIFDIVHTQPFGNTSVAMLKSNALPPGMLLIEAIFRLEAIAPKSLNLQKSLPQQFIRMLFTEKGQNLSEKISPAILKPMIVPLDVNSARQVVKARKDLISERYRQAETIAIQTAQEWSESAQRIYTQQLQEEIDRLEYLRQKNPSIRQDEINRLIKAQEQGVDHLKQLAVVPDAIRVLVTVKSN